MRAPHRSHRPLVLSVLLAFALLVASCGGGSTPADDASSPADASPTTAAVANDPTPAPTESPAGDPTPIPDPTSTPEPAPTATPEPDRDSAITFLESAGAFTTEEAACTADAGYAALGTYDLFNISAEDDALMESIAADCSAGSDGDSGDDSADEPAEVLGDESARMALLPELDPVDVLSDDDVECLADVIYDVFGEYNIPEDAAIDQVTQLRDAGADCVTSLGGPAAGSPAPGTDAELDALWEQCSAGDAAACDDLFFSSPLGSDYEQYGWTCGGLTAFDSCTILLGLSENAFTDSGGAFDLDLIPNPDAPAPGEDAELDRLWDECAAESAAGCDELYLQSDAGSVYEAFGWTCGGRDANISCSDLFGTSSIDGTDVPAIGSPPPGDDPVLDKLWTACSDGDADACTDLFYESPLDSVYESWGLSCGGSPVLTLPCDE